VLFGVFDEVGAFAFHLNSDRGTVDLSMPQM
jgi:hypothetical protein